MFIKFYRLSDMSLNINELQFLTFYVCNTFHLAFMKLTQLFNNAGIKISYEEEKT